MSYFHRTASEGTQAEALAAFYAYESQVPRVAQEKARGLPRNLPEPTKRPAATSPCTPPLMFFIPMYGVSSWKSSCGKS